MISSLRGKVTAEEYNYIIELYHSDELINIENQIKEYNKIFDNWRISPEQFDGKAPEVLAEEFNDMLENIFLFYLRN